MVGWRFLRATWHPTGVSSKLAAVSLEMMHHQGPARVFDGEEAALAAILGGQIKRGDVVVIRYEGHAVALACARC